VTTRRAPAPITVTIAAITAIRITVTVLVVISPTTVTITAVAMFTTTITVIPAFPTIVRVTVGRATMSHVLPRSWSVRTISYGIVDADPATIQVLSYQNK
jgi:hypothetical protein